MKKNILTLLLGLVAMSVMAEEPFAQITFENRTHDFGTVAQDTCIVTCLFQFTNTGTMPLVIHQAIASCGCTVPEYTQEPIAPGEKGAVKVTYNGKTKRPGIFKKSITIHSNSKETPTRIYIQGEMIPAVNIAEEIEEPKQ